MLSLAGGCGCAPRLTSRLCHDVGSEELLKRVGSGGRRLGIQVLLRPGPSERIYIAREQVLAVHGVLK